MNRPTNIITRAGILSLALCAAAGAAFAQGPGDGPGGQGGQGGQGGPGGPHGRPPLPPVFQALDTNHDGIIEPDEIANAAQSLKTLLKSGSSSLTVHDLLGPPPPHGPPPGQGNDGGPGGMQLANPPAQSGSSGQGPMGDPPGPPPGGPGGHHPMPPVIRALDTNHDGVIEADEIANAAQSLKTLIRPGYNELSIQDLLGRPPHRPRQQGQGNNQDGPPGPPPDQGGQGGPDGQGGPPPPPDWGAPPAQSGTNGQNQPPPPPPQ
jgi:hypothetical protein